MWSEICELVPLTTGLDICIEHDIEQLIMCAKANKEKGYDALADAYLERAERLVHRKQQLDKMSPLKRWWHCETQYIRSKKEREKVIKEYRSRLNVII